MKQNVKCSLIIFFYVFCALQLNAKDLITRCDGVEIEALVTEVGTNEIKYKKADNPDGPVYVVPVSDLFSVKYNVNTPQESKDMFLCNSPSVSTKQMEANYYAYQNLPKRKDPGVAWLWSFIIPGGGQYYNGEYVKGGIMTGISLVSIIGLAASSTTTYYYDSGYYGGYHEENNNDAAIALCAIGYFGTYIWSMVDAVVVAKKINKKNGLLSWKVSENSILSLRPDLNVYNPSPTGGVTIAPTVGMGVKLNF